MQSRLARLLYRSLLASARKHDAAPILKAHFINPVRRNKNSERLDEEKQLLQKYATFIFKNGRYYQPTVHFSGIVRHFFEEHKNLTGKDQENAINSAFSALKYLNNNIVDAEESNVKIHDPIEQHDDGDYSIELTQKVEPGVLLIAHPLLLGSVFERSVILVTSHAKPNNSYQGGMSAHHPKQTGGIILNVQRNEKQEPIGPKVIPINDSIAVFAVQQAPPTKIVNPDLYFGGPVTPTLRNALFIRPEAKAQLLDRFQLQDDGFINVSKDLFYGAAQSLNKLEQYVRKGVIKATQVRKFQGCSEWSQNQLQEEIDNGLWVVVKCSDINKVVNERGATIELWNKLLRKLGGEYAYWQNMPTDVHLPAKQTPVEIEIIQ